MSINDWSRDQGRINVECNIYRRNSKHGVRYEVRWWAEGRRYRKLCGSLAEARQVRAASKVPAHA